MGLDFEGVGWFVGGLVGGVGNGLLQGAKGAVVGGAGGAVAGAAVGAVVGAPTGPGEVLTIPSGAAAGAAGGAVIGGGVGAVEGVKAGVPVGQDYGASAGRWLDDKISQMTGADEEADKEDSNVDATDACSTCPPPEEEGQKKPKQKNVEEYAERLKGKKYEDAEGILDKELRDEAGWTKAGLKRGDGVRYYDGKGSAVSLNKGYPEGLKGGGGDLIHQNPYVKIQPSGTRIPLG